jgi:hypothetical protein
MPFQLMISKIFFGCAEILFRDMDKVGSASEFDIQYCTTKTDFSPKMPIVSPNSFWGFKA